MHILHKILVHIPDAVACREGCDRDSLRSEIRNYAEDSTEIYCKEVFDWRETGTAGRWSSDYPVNVLLASEDAERFEKELQEVQCLQSEKIQTCLEDLKKTAGMDLEQIVQALASRAQEQDHALWHSSYLFFCLASYLHGRYRCDSYFYNTYNNTARLYASDIERIRETPQDWAMVLFDYHY